MTGLIIFSGTTEGRRLAEELAEAGMPSTVCVATEYGSEVMPENKLVDVVKGRMNAEEMERFFRENYSTDKTLVIDATHPYASEVSVNIKKAAEACGISYIRLVRAAGVCAGTGGYTEVSCFESAAECAGSIKALVDQPGFKGNILLTTGSKELGVYAADEAVRSRLVVRVLPAAESLELCRRFGLTGRQIIAMQGPFSVEMNEALIREFGITALVTKESGAGSGYAEKLEACRRTGTKALVIRRPAEQGLSYEEVLELIKQREKTLP